MVIWDIIMLIMMSLQCAIVEQYKNRTQPDQIFLIGGECMSHGKFHDFWAGHRFGNKETEDWVADGQTSTDNNICQYQWHPWVERLWQLDRIYCNLLIGNPNTDSPSMY